MRFLVPHSRAGTAWRVLLAAILVVGCSAGAVATAGLLEVNTIVQEISVNAGITSKQLTLPKPGVPETILLIGSDHRYGEAFADSHTDTILLVHLNAASSTINVMSIPRDLRVNVPSSYVPASECGTSTVPGDCAEKINAAYSQGSYGLLIRTIRSNVFPDLKINHIVDTNFTGFSDLVDAIGCVYADVDHRYYNNTALTGYSSIDIQPGYQRLCGHNQAVNGALPFVRFRHTDSDLVREARQQDFLRWAKQNFTTRQLFDERGKLLHIFGKHSTLDKELQSNVGLLDLFNLVLDSNGDTLKQTPFPANNTDVVIGGADYVTAIPSQEQIAYRKFISPTRPVKQHAAAPRHRAAHRSAHRPRRAAGINTAGLVADPADGIAQAKILTPDMPVYYPRLIDSQAEYCTPETAECLDDQEPADEYAHSYPREYTVREPDGRRVHAYYMTIVINALQGQYYGVQGLHWTDAPILRDPQARKVFRGRTYELYEDDGGHFTDIAFRSGPDVYWISNTLTSSIPNHEMMAIAESMTRYRG